MYTKDLRTGAEGPLIDFAGQVTVDDWTADGRFVIVREMSSAGKIMRFLSAAIVEPKLIVDIPGFDARPVARLARCTLDCL